MSSEPFVRGINFLNIFFFSQRKILNGSLYMTIIVCKSWKVDRLRGKKALYQLETLNRPSENPLNFVDWLRLNSEFGTFELWKLGEGNNQDFKDLAYTISGAKLSPKQTQDFQQLPRIVSWFGVNATTVFISAAWACG